MNNAVKVVFVDPIGLTDESIAELKALCDLAVYVDVPNGEDEILRRIDGADIITANWISITDKIIRSSPTLKYIVVPAVGYEWIDIRAANDAGISVLNCPTHNSRAVAEFTIAMVFAVARRVIEANTDLRAGVWKPVAYTGMELASKRLGLIGYGRIGQQVAQMAECAGMEVRFANSKTSPGELDQLIAESDVISLNLPLTAGTLHLIDERRLRLMKEGAYLINTARGALVDQKALVEALKSGHLSGAALDVFENEPMTGVLREDLRELIALRNVVATPHIAFNTEEASRRLGTEIVRNIESCINGSPINVVNCF